VDTRIPTTLMTQPVANRAHSGSMCRSRGTVDIASRFVIGVRAPTVGFSFGSTDNVAVSREFVAGSSVFYGTSRMVSPWHSATELPRPKCGVATSVSVGGTSGSGRRTPAIDDVGCSFIVQSPRAVARNRVHHAEPCCRIESLHMISVVGRWFGSKPGSLQKSHGGVPVDSRRS